MPNLLSRGLKYMLFMGYLYHIFKFELYCLGVHLDLGVVGLHVNTIL